MSTNDREQQRYEALCAYVLGELSGDEKAEIERQLEESAELRAQRDELEATIGLVRGSLGGGEELSEAAAASVLARVGGGAGSGVDDAPASHGFRLLRGGRPWFKVAAGVAFLTLGYGGWKAFSDRSSAVSVLDNTDVAEADVQHDRISELELQALKELGYTDGFNGVGYTSDAEAKEDAVALGASPQPSPENRTSERLQALGYTSTPQAAPKNQLGLPSVDGAEADRTLRLNARSEMLEAELVRRTRSSGDDARKAGKKEGRLATLQSATPGQQGGQAQGSQTFIGGAFSGEAVNVYREAGPSAGYPMNPNVVPNTPSVGVMTVTEATPPTRLVDGATSVGANSYFLAGRGEPAASPPGTVDSPQVVDEVLRGLGYVGGPGSGSAGVPVVTELPPAAAERSLRGRRQEVLGQDLERLGEAGEDEFFVGTWHGWQADRAWTPEERQRYLEHECQRILDNCRRKPREHPRDMYFRYWGDNPFEFAQLDPLSTFAVDVDTASYTLARNYLNKGMIPPKAQVRTEEFVNYFKADVPAPTEETFSVVTELAPSRFGGGDPNVWMMSVAVCGREVAETERKPLCLTFVVDTSGSMKKENRMELVKHSLRLLLGKLDANDSIAIVAFSNEARLILPMTSAAQRGVIESAIYPLAADGGTNAEAGLKMGYEASLAGHNELATNRVVFLSDGVANIGQTDQDRITRDVTSHRERGIYLNTVGVGMGNHNDVFLEQLANNGDGLCNYVDSPAAARKALVENFTGQFEPIARDVKLQVEFDPAQVARYRLLGYENRAIADADFRNDAVDAGEVNAGHQIVALYEIERMPSASADGPLATVRLRWKLPHGKTPIVVGNDIHIDLEASDEAFESEHPVSAAKATSYQGASYGYRRSVVVAQFAELLRRSRHAREDSLEDLIAEAQALRAQRPGDVELTELVALLQQSRTLILNSIPACDELCQTIDEIRIRNLQMAQIELLQKDSALIQELRDQNQKLEGAIRDLLNQRLQQQGR